MADPRDRPRATCLRSAPLKRPANANARLRASETVCANLLLFLPRSKGRLVRGSAFSDTEGKGGVRRFVVLLLFQSLLALSSLNALLTKQTR